MRIRSPRPVRQLAPFRYAHPDLPAPPAVPPNAKQILPTNFWTSHERRRLYLQFLASQVSGLDGLYSLAYQDFKLTGGISLLNYYNDSPALAIMGELPEHHWQPWRFSYAPRNWWLTLGQGFRAGHIQAETTVRQIIEECAKNNRVEAMEDWRRLMEAGRVKDLPIGLTRHVGPLEAILPRLSPKFDWKVDKPQDIKDLEAMEVPRVRGEAKYWREPANMFRFLQLASHAPSTSLPNIEALYQLNSTSILRRGGVALLAKFDYSPAEAISCLYPDVSWKRWRFDNHKSKLWWRAAVRGFDEGDVVASATVAEFLLDFAADHQVRTPLDWVNVKPTQTLQYILAEHFGQGVLVAVVARAFPHMAEDLARAKRFQSEPSLVQHELALNVQEIIPSALDFHSPAMTDLKPAA